MNTFTKRLTEVLFYPKLCKYSDVIHNKEDYILPLTHSIQESKKEMIVYIHVPFCRHLCFYCSYFKEPLSRYTYNDRKAYFDACVLEMEKYAKMEYFSDKKVKAVQIGGGTPTAVEPEFIEQMLTAVRKNFNMSECELITMEGNIFSLQDEQRLGQYKDMGVERLSIGIQTFNEELRKKLKITSSVPQIYEAIEKINRVGFKDYSMDLMYNLPGQEVEEVVKNIETIDTLHPKYIDIYSLNIFPNTKFKEVIDKGGYFRDKPSDEKNTAMTKAIINTFTRLHYTQIMAFAYSKRSKKIPVHVDLFFNGGNVLGIGASSRSYLHGLNFRNLPKVHPYITQITSGKLPIECGMVVSELEQIYKEMVFFPLYMEKKKSEIRRYDLFEKTLKDLIEGGYIEDDGEYIRLTEEGRAWPGNIALMFYSDEQKKKHNVSFFQSLKYKDNPFNQDKMGVPGKMRS